MGCTIILIEIQPRLLAAMHDAMGRTRLSPRRKLYLTLNRTEYPVLAQSNLYKPEHISVFDLWQCTQLLAAVCNHRCSGGGGGGGRGGRRGCGLSL